MNKKDELKEHFLAKDVQAKLKDVNQHIHGSDLSREIKDPLLAKSEELEQAIGTNNFKERLEEFTGLLLEYEQYIPALFAFLKL